MKAKGPRKIVAPRVLDARGGGKVRVVSSTPKYISALEASKIMKLSKIRVKQLLQEGRIKGARKVGNYTRSQWIIPTPIVLLEPK